MITPGILFSSPGIPLVHQGCWHLSRKVAVSLCIAGHRHRQLCRWFFSRHLHRHGRGRERRRQTINSLALAGAGTIAVNANGGAGTLLSLPAINGSSLYAGQLYQPPRHRRRRRLWGRWRRHGINGGQVWGGGEFNYHNNVDVGDLGALATNYGVSPGNGPMADVAGGAMSVPEPLDLSMIACVIMAIAPRRTRRQRRAK
jgi:hypothetical protein